MTIESITRGEFLWIERAVLACSQIVKQNGYDEIRDVQEIPLPKYRKNGRKYPEQMIENCLKKGYAVNTKDGYFLANKGYHAYNYYRTKPDKREVTIERNLCDDKVVSLYKVKQAEENTLYVCERCNSRLILPLLQGGIVDKKGNIKHCTKKRVCAMCFMNGILNSVD